MARMTVNVAKITCKQYILYEVVDGRTLAVWLSGYYSAQRGTTLVDIADLQAKADVVREYCFRHYDEPLMDAVRKTLERPNRLCQAQHFARWRRTKETRR